jgi:hypothetical protein
LPPASPPFAVEIDQAAIDAEQAVTGEAERDDEQRRRASGCLLESLEHVRRALAAAAGQRQIAEQQVDNAAGGEADAGEGL